MQELTVQSKEALFDRIRTVQETANAAGLYYTYRYFIAFAPRFKLSDGIVAEMKDATCNPRQLHDTVLADKLYTELKAVYDSGEFPSQIGRAILFARYSPIGIETYTSIFGN